ncbi:hypothetical protein JCM10212_004119 [Sporobolomyces blumeae]
MTSRPAFIFSYNHDDSDIRALSRSLAPPLDHLTATSTSTLPSSSRHAGLGLSREAFPRDDDFIPYGPTTHRRGPMRFVPAKQGGGFLASTDADLDPGDDRPTVKVEGKGKGRATDGIKYESDDEDRPSLEPTRPPPPRTALSGSAVRGLYASIVGLRTEPSATRATSTDHSEAPPRIPTKRTRAPSIEADIVLSSDSDVEIKDEDETRKIDDDGHQPADDDNGQDEEEVVVLDPLTNLPESRSLGSASRRRQGLQPLLIHELLADRRASDPALVPPTYYAVPESNYGYRILAKQGWKAGRTLGPDGSGAKGLKVPLKAVEKFDRRGLGSESNREGSKARRKMTEREKEEERRNETQVERDRRGKGARGMARQKKKEADERKAWISYMNR